MLMTPHTPTSTTDGWPSTLPIRAASRFFGPDLDRRRQAGLTQPHPDSEEARIRQPSFPDAVESLDDPPQLLRSRMQDRGDLVLCGGDLSRLSPRVGKMCPVTPALPPAGP